MSVYDIVTERILEQMQNGIIPWQNPVHGGFSGAVSYSTGRPYSIINQFVLGKPGEYATFLQVKNAGGKVKKGAKSKPVVFWKMLPYQKTDGVGVPVFTSEGEADMKNIPYLRYYSVFHLDDCEGIESKWDKKIENPVDPIAEAEAMFHEYMRREQVGFDEYRASNGKYSLTHDKIVMPLLEQFTDAAEYYSTAFHEAVHSTGHEKRLTRFKPIDNRDIEKYSQEELIAEIGAAVILNRLGIETKSSIKNNAAYIQNWMQALKNDTKLVVLAAGKAEKAVRLIVNEQSEESEESEVA